jgi:hypothetical protein
MHTPVATVRYPQPINSAIFLHHFEVRESRRVLSILENRWSSLRFAIFLSVQHLEIL